jgi:hypothetical protein
MQSSHRQRPKLTHEREVRPGSVTHRLLRAALRQRSQAEEKSTDVGRLNERFSHHRIWRSFVVRYTKTYSLVKDVSEEHVTSVFRVQKCVKQETSFKEQREASRNGGSNFCLLHSGFLLGLLLDPKGDISLRNFGYFLRVAWYHISEYKTLYGRLQWTLITFIKEKLHGLSPRAYYTDRATAACRRSDCQLLRIEGSTWSAWRIPTAVLSVFWTGAATFLSSSSSVVLTRLSGPRSRSTTFFSGSAGNRTRVSGSVAKNSDH